jgi:hypothetical protein
MKCFFEGGFPNGNTEKEAKIQKNLFLVEPSERRPETNLEIEKNFPRFSLFKNTSPKAGNPCEDSQAFRAKETCLQVQEMLWFL